MYNVQFDFGLPTLRVEQHLNANTYVNTVYLYEQINCLWQKCPFEPVKGLIHQ